MKVETKLEARFGPVSVASNEALELVMQELWLTGSVLPVGAVLEVRHLFKCSQTNPVEAVYAFPLPRDATLRAFRVIGEGFSIRSELKPTAKATQQYEEGIAAGNLSTLARIYRDGIVNLSLGNLRPGETVLVVLEILAGVENRDDGMTFRFPFTLAPAYHARARVVESEPNIGEIELPEDEFEDVMLPRWVNDARDLHRIGFDLDIMMGDSISDVTCPSHKIRLKQKQGDVVTVQLATESDIPNRDLVLQVRTSNERSQTFGGIAPNGKGQFIAVVPSSHFGQQTDGPRSFVFVIDRSSSMSGEPFRQAVRAVKACLNTLSENDRFGIVAFDDSVEVFVPYENSDKPLCKATEEHRAEAAQFLDEISPRGGTELAEGIDAACDILSQSGGGRFLF